MKKKATTKKITKSKQKGSSLKEKLLTKKLEIVLGVLVLYLLFLAIYPAYTSPDEVEVIPIHITVGKILGFNVDTDAIWFGTIPPQGTGGRALLIENKDNITKRVTIASSGNTEFMKWLTVSENKFTLGENELKTIQIKAAVPGNATYGNYSGNLTVLFYNLG